MANEPINDDPNKPTEYDTAPLKSQRPAGEARGDFPELQEEETDPLVEFRQQAEGFIRKRPGLSLVLALGAGYLLGKAFARRT